MSGDRTIGSIQIEEKVSTGESGENYLGRQPGLGRKVMLRKLRRDLLSSPTLVERFRREARLSARVQHANVVQVFDFFAARGDHYLVLEHVDGSTLRAVLEHTGKLPANIAARIALELARGVEEIQRRGIVHCDIRPENVLVSRWGEVKLTGLGSAREVGDLEPPEPIEITAYSAPELQPGSEVDSQADVYSLGAVLCELLSGRAPQHGLAAAAAAKPFLARTLRRCLHENPTARPRLATLRRALERSTQRGEEDPRIAIAAWMWEIRMLRPSDPGNLETAPTPEVPPAADPPAEEAVAASGRRRIPIPRREQILPVSAAAAAFAVLMLAIALGDFWSTEDDSAPSADSAPPVSAAPPSEPPPKEIATKPAPKPALISFVVVPWAEIQVGETPRFLTPRAAPVELPPGRHDLFLRHPKYGEVQRTLVVRSGEERVVRHVFERTNP